MNYSSSEILNSVNAVTNASIPGNTDDMELSQAELLNMPDRNRIIAVFKKLMVVLFPEYFHYQNLNQADAMKEAVAELETEVEHALMYHEGSSERTEQVLSQFFEFLPHIKYMLLTDIQAIYDGDPAAKSKTEVILCYPGFYAIAIYRMAHALYRLNVPCIPRIITEYAHEKTGIDINPGATIGEYFCIDHGTGIVIGETSTIGDHVKLYQGVTIGAKSFEKDEHGNPVKGGKRHPDIGNHVVIYANATILGGKTRIGDYATIGGNVWVVNSVEDHAVVAYNQE